MEEHAVLCAIKIEKGRLLFIDVTQTMTSRNRIQKRAHDYDIQTRLYTARLQEN